ncbi:MAG: hypothetical protein ACRD1Y_09040 [Terriglobales bacterium]
MSTLRSIERRLYVRRQMDRDLASQAVVGTGEVPRHMEWNGIWTGYMTFAGVAIILLSFVLAIGFSSLNPFSAGSWRSVGGGVMGWSVVVILIATWLGCWVAARTPKTTKKHGMMKGITLWAMILLTILLVVGWVASTTIGAVSSAATVPVAAAAAPAAPAAALPPAAAAPGTPAATAPTATAPTQGALAGAAQKAGAVTKHVGGNLMWGLFWIALIGLGLALFAGAVGGGGISFRRSNRPTNQPAA